MHSPATSVVATQEQISTELEGEVVILNTKTGRYYTLEGAGTDLWRHLQDEVKVADLCDTIEARYDVTPERCKADILALLKDLGEAGLVEVVG